MKQFIMINFYAGVILIKLMICWTTEVLAQMVLYNMTALKNVVHFFDTFESSAAFRNQIIVLPGETNAWFLYETRLWFEMG